MVNGLYSFAPSLICGDLLNLSDSIQHLHNQNLNLVHIDVMDNQFVKGFGFTPAYISQIKEISTIYTDVHLMANPSVDIAKEFIKAQADRIILHVEVSDLHETAELILNSKSELGLAIKPDTPLNSLEPLCKYASTILVFTVNPGQRGQEIRSDAIDRIKKVRNLLDKNNYSCTLQVDGGVYAHSIKGLYDAGARTFVLGSAFFGANGKGDPSILMNQLINELEKRDGYISKLS